MIGFSLSDIDMETEVIEAEFDGDESSSGDGGQRARRPMIDMRVGRQSLHGTRRAAKQ
jgi:hypothetical protein